MRKSKALEYRKYIVKASGSLTDEELLKVPNLTDPWKPGMPYVTGDRVRYPDTEECRLYKCIIDHTSQNTWTPTAAPSLWAKVLIPDENVIPEWEQPDSTNPYQIGDRVMYNGQIWESIVPNNVWAPGVYGWVPIEE